MATIQTAAPPYETIGCTEHTLTLRDGMRLFYRAWTPPKPFTRALLLFHRGHEHSGRWQETVETLGLEDTAVFAWDQRGHGRSGGERGSAPDFATMVRDAEQWTRHLVSAHGLVLEDTIVIAQSLGAVIATAWIHDYAPPVRGLVLVAPAFRVRLYVPFAVPLLRLRQRLFGPGYVKSYVKAGMLTHDPEEAKRYAADSLIFRQVAVNLLLDLHDASTRLLKDAAAITTRLLVLAAGSDWVVSTSAQRQFIERAGSANKRFEVLPGFSHAILHEKERALGVSKLRTFIEECFSTPDEHNSHSAENRQSYTWREYERLSSRGPMRFCLIRGLMKGPGRLSRGIALGWKHGFDSGVMLDYIYENRAQGTTFIGRMIDRFFLNAIGWRGIRVRRILLQQALRSIILQTHAAGRPVRLLDIASGPARYVLETIHELRGIPVSVTLRDYRQENLDAAAELRDRLGISNVTLALGNAFDRRTLAAVKPRPTIALVSGLYELIPANELVLASLRGLVDALEPGAHLIYTNQPWHPQIDFIARVLTNREGQPWIMRRRTQAEMDELVRQAGFEKLSQDIDPWGMFSVSLAVRSDR
jgi:alpha-beta hydrolase superfamily lysophospholipase